MRKHTRFEKLDAGNSVLFLLYFDEHFDATQHLDKLTEIELERYYSFKNQKRRNEFVATRLLKHDLFGYNEIRYKEHGAPFIEDEGYISISHANLLIGIAFNERYQIGFDVEEIHDKVKNVHTKFLNQHEYTLFDSSKTLDLIIAWSLKETLYKLAGRNFLDFKKDLLILSKSNQSYDAKIINPDEEILVKLEAKVINGYVLTFNVEPVVYVEK
jgi:4'-phosphopantetheinyl transferase